MWNGTAPNLKAMATTTNDAARMNPSPGSSPSRDDSAPSSSVPAMPYITDMPYSSVPEAMAPSTKYFHRGLGGDAGVPVEGDDGVQRQRQQFHADVDGQQVGGRCHHQHAEQCRQRQHVELALLQPPPRQVVAAVEQRKAANRKAPILSSDESRSATYRPSKTTERSVMPCRQVMAAPITSTTSVSVAVRPGFFSAKNRSNSSTRQMAPVR